MIRVYFHVCGLNNFNEISHKILARIKNSGLLDACESINAVYLGNMNDLDAKLFEDPKINLTHFDEDISFCEFPTLSKLWEDSQKEPFKALYVHTKGVSKVGWIQVQDWLDYFLYFNVDLWKDRVVDLDDWDASSVNLGGESKNLKQDPSLWGHGYSPMHYSGNIWWANSSHIKTLPNPMKDYTPSEEWYKYRHMCEMWVCGKEDGKYKNNWSSNINHYHQRYDKKLYMKELT